MTREDLIEKYVAGHAACRWMDAGDLDDLLHSFVKELDSLEPASEDLGQEVKRYYSDNFDYISSDQPTLSILTNIARHFAQWQKEQDDELLTIAHLDGVTKGRKTEREQIMKDAVKGRYMKENGKLYVESWPLDIDPDSAKAGDEVSLIVSRNV